MKKRVDFHTIQSILKLFKHNLKEIHSGYFHTIQSILKPGQNTELIQINITFPYYSVYFKAQHHHHSNYKPSYFHTIQSILKLSTVAMLKNITPNFHTIQSILKHLEIKEEQEEIERISILFSLF